MELRLSIFRSAEIFYKNFFLLLKIMAIEIIFILMDIIFRYLIMDNLKRPTLLIYLLIYLILISVINIIIRIALIFVANKFDKNENVTTQMILTEIKVKFWTFLKTAIIIAFLIFLLLMPIYILDNRSIFAGIIKIISLLVIYFFMLL